MDPILTIKILQFVLVFVAGFFGVMLLVILWKNRDEIRAFFDPGGWAEVTMMELDNNVSTWLQQKKFDLKFKFNDGSYNLFHSGTHTKDVKVKKKDEQGNEIEVIEQQEVLEKNPSIYRSGRLAKFFYREGNEDPIDFRQISVTGNPQINEQMLKVDISRWFMSAEGLGAELLNKFGIFIVIGLGLLLLYIAFIKKDPPATNESVKNIALMMALWKLQRKNRGK